MQAASDSNTQKNGAKVENFRRKRHIGYIILTIVLLVVPFICIGEAQNHIFLLSFDHKVLHVLGIEYTHSRVLCYDFYAYDAFCWYLFYQPYGGEILVWLGLSADYFPLLLWWILFKLNYLD